MNRSINPVAETASTRMTIRIDWVPDFDTESATTRACSLDVMDSCEIVDAVA